MNKEVIIRTVPAAGALHNVPGFDPVKYLHEEADEAGKPVMRLPLSYKKLWFRLACPDGRLQLDHLRITDQLAIFDAKVFFRKDDPAPASSYTSSKTAKEAPAYIRAAQDEALSTALDNAGFGIQLHDITQPLEDVAAEPPEALTSAPEAAESPTTQAADTPATQTAEAPIAQPEEAPAVQTAEAPASQVKETPIAQAADTPALKAAEAPAPKVEEAPAPKVEEAPVPEAEETTDSPAQPEDDRQTGSTLLTFPGTAANASGEEMKNDASVSSLSALLAGEAPQTDNPAAASPNEAPTPAEAPGAAQEESENAPSYTADMTVEEICERMTLEEAQAVTVPKGPFAGLTMGKVAERRFSSLRFYVTEFSSFNNIEKAAATLLIRESEQKKAS